MKLSVAIAGENAPPTAFVVWRGFEASIRKASEYGYSGVELALREADEVQPRELERWLRRWNLEVSCISTGQVFATLGLYFTHPDHDARTRLVGVFARLIRLARDFGRMVNVGRVRGFYPETQSREEVERLFVETAERVCDLASAGNVTILIEPLNRYETNFVCSLDDAARLLSVLGRKNVGLMPDLFHMNIEEPRLGPSLIRHGALIRYIHLADSNRLAPGQGHLDFEEIFTSLKKGGFDGWASIEILPMPDPDSAARQAVEYLAPFLERFNNEKESNSNRDDTSRQGV